MKRILTMLAGASLVAGLFAALPAPAKALPTGGGWQVGGDTVYPDVVVAPRDRGTGPSGTCTNPDYTSINAAIDSLDDDSDFGPGPDSWVLGICKGTYIQRESITLWDSWTIVGQGASKTVIDGSQLEWFSSSNDGIIEEAYEDIVVSNITFKGGTGSDGGAIYTDSDFGCVASNFVGNRAIAYDEYSGEGGAVYAVGDINLWRCTFRNNSADVSGGAIYGESNIVDSGSTYTLNSAGYGGAIGQGAAMYDDSMQIVNSTFTKNTAVIGDGGAIFADDGNTYIERSTFVSNFAYASGGALAKAGCTADVDGWYPTLTDDYVGVAYELCQMQIHDSTFTSNTANETGGAVASLDKSTGLSVTGSKFQLNRATAGAGLISAGYVEAGNNVFTRNSGLSVIEHQVNKRSEISSCIWEGGFGEWGYIYLLTLLDTATGEVFTDNQFTRNSVPPAYLVSRSWYMGSEDYILLTVDSSGCFGG